MSLRELVSDYEAKTGGSRALFEEAQRVLPLDKVLDTEEPW